MPGQISGGWAVPFTAGLCRCQGSWPLSSLGGSLDLHLLLWPGFTFATFCHLNLLPFLILHLLTLQIRGWPPICMNEDSFQDDVAEITIRIRGLVVTVSGPPSQAARFVEEVTRGAGASTRSSSPGQRSLGSYTVVESSPRPSRVEAPETRQEIERSFRPCPDSCLDRARALGGPVEDARGRVRRAWLAGCWARATLDGRCPSPNRTPPLQLRSRIYVVLRAPSISSPACFASSGSYWRCVGDLRYSSSVSHSFPSETEARIYCSAAGETFPTVQP